MENELSESTEPAPSSTDYAPKGDTRSSGIGLSSTESSTETNTACIPIGPSCGSGVTSPWKGSDRHEGMILFRARMILEGKWQLLGENADLRKPEFKDYASAEVSAATAMGYVGFDDEFNRGHNKPVSAPVLSDFDPMSAVKEAYDKVGIPGLTRANFVRESAFTWYTRYDKNPDDTWKQMNQFILAPIIKAKPVEAQTEKEAADEAEDASQREELLALIRERKGAGE